MPGSEMLARTASMSDPSRIQTSLPVLRSVATAEKGTDSSSIIGSDRIPRRYPLIFSPSTSPERGIITSMKPMMCDQDKFPDPPIQRIEKSGRI